MEALNEIISLVRRWMNYGAANRGWNEIYEHMEKQTDSETLTQPDPGDPNNPDVIDSGRDTADSACAISPVSQKDHSASPNTCSEDDDSNYTSVSYRHLTIKIPGKIAIDNNLISLSIYEVRSYVRI